MIEAVRAPAITVPHAFLGRTGGVSDGIFASLNVGLGSSDAPVAVHENRVRALASVGAPTLVTLHQVHSPDVITVTGPIPVEARPQADAMVTAVAGLALGILTADCAPVLFADDEVGVIGAAHAGWKGAIGGVLANTVTAMEGLGADRSRIVAAIGPCIARRSYEVDAGFFRRFAETDPDYAGFFTPGREGHHQFDLEGFVAARLAAAGLRTVIALSEDTYSQGARYFSYRRTTHAGEPDYGRQLSLIALPG